MLAARVQGALPKEHGLDHRWQNIQESHQWISDCDHSTSRKQGINLVAVRTGAGAARARALSLVLLVLLMLLLFLVFLVFLATTARQPQIYPERNIAIRRRELTACWSPCSCQPHPRQHRPQYQASHGPSCCP